MPTDYSSGGRKYTAQELERLRASGYAGLKQAMQSPKATERSQFQKNVAQNIDYGMRRTPPEK